MMLPMSVRCNTCGEYMYKGKKFNSRKEDVEGPEGEYLGIKIFRFYFKCVTCSAEFTIKTDPRNMDYEVEGGARANYVPYKDEANQRKAAIEERLASEKDDTMKQLENKTKDSKIEMDILDALDDIRSQNSRVARLEMDDVIEQHRRQTEREQREEEERRVAAVSVDDDEVTAFAEQRIKRLRDDQPAAAASLAQKEPQAQRAPSASTSKKPRLPPVLIVQSKASASKPTAPAPAALDKAKVAAPALANNAPASASSGAAGSASGGALLGLCGYNSGSGSSSPSSER